jgi:hypothetical protein
LRRGRPSPLPAAPAKRYVLLARASRDGVAAAGSGARQEFGDLALGAGPVTAFRATDRVLRWPPLLPRMPPPRPTVNRRCVRGRCTPPGASGSTRTHARGRAARSPPCSTTGPTTLLAAHGSAVDGRGPAACATGAGAAPAGSPLQTLPPALNPPRRPSSKVSAPTGVGAPERPVEQGFFGLRRPGIRLGRITLRVQRDGRNVTVEVRSDGEGLVSHAGSALLMQIADKSGLRRALSVRLAGLKQRRSGHDPGVWSGISR